MKTQALFASITLALAGSAFAAGDKHDHARERSKLCEFPLIVVKSRIQMTPQVSDAVLL